MNPLSKHWKNKTVRDAFALYIGRCIGIVLGFIATLIYGVIFFKPEIAVISLFEMVLNLFISFGFTWSKIAITRYGGEELHKHNSLNFTSSIRLGIIFPILLISTLCIIYYRNDLLNYIGTNDSTITIFLVVTLVLFVIHQHITNILITAERHVQNVWFFLGESFGKVLILLSFYYHVVGEVNAEQFVKYTCYLYVVLLVFRSIFLKYKYVFPVVIGNFQDYYQSLKYVFPQIYGLGGLYIINWVDVYFIRKYMALDDLGGYQFLYSIFIKLAGSAVILNNIFFPKIMKWKITDDQKLKTFLDNMPFYGYIASIVIFSGILIFYKKILFMLFQDKYINAYPAFSILILSIPFYYTTFVFVPVLNGFDNVKFIQIVNLLAASLNFFIDYFFIKTYGLKAAAIGTFIAYFTTYLLLSIKVQSLFHIKYKFLNVTSVLIFFATILYFSQLS